MVICGALLLFWGLFNPHFLLSCFSPCAGALVCAKVSYVLLMELHCLINSVLNRSVLETEAQAVLLMGILAMCAHIWARGR